MSERIEGLLAAPLTGFTSDGAVNPDVIPDYARLLHGDGVVGVFVNGTTGEGQLLTPEERLELAEGWITSAPPEMKTIIHVTHPDLKVSCELAAHAQESGAWGIGAMGPLNQDDVSLSQVVDQVAQIAEAAGKLPCYYYHIPDVSGIHIDVRAMLEEALAGLSFA